MFFQRETQENLAHLHIFLHKLNENSIVLFYTVHYTGCHCLTESNVPMESVRTMQVIMLKRWQKRFIALFNS